MSKIFWIALVLFDVVAGGYLVALVSDLHQIAGPVGAYGW
jgi:hypothetical protein